MSCRGREEIADPACDPERPRVITYDNVVAAKARLDKNVIRSQLKRSQLSEEFNMEIYLKLENQQVTGSFKDRGALNAVSSLANTKGHKIGVVSASAGNHAIALSYAAHKHGNPAVVVMPVSAPLVKIEKCRKYEAEVILHGHHIGEAKELAQRIARDRNYVYINGYDHPDIISGQGTVALEILEELPLADAIIVPTGGGGLLAGVVAVVKELKPDCRVIGVESMASTGFRQAIEAGHPVDTNLDKTLALGLAVPKSGVNALATAINCREQQMATVSESSIISAILKLFEAEKTVAEGAGAAGVAALMEGQLTDLEGKKVVILITGGNIDTTLMGDILHKGLAMERRMVSLEITTPNVSSLLPALSMKIAEVNCSLKAVHTETVWHGRDSFTNKVRCLIETRSDEHFQELQSSIDTISSSFSNYSYTF